MSILDAARAIRDREPWDVGEPAPACVFCGGFKMDRHRPDCPWLSMSKIVAALEAAERLVATQGGAEEPEMGCCGGCTSERCGPADLVFCDGTSGWPKNEHKADCPWQALVAALKGD